AGAAAVIADSDGVSEIAANGQRIGAGGHTHKEIGIGASSARIEQRKPKSATSMSESEEAIGDAADLQLEDGDIGQARGRTQKGPGAATINAFPDGEVGADVDGLLILRVHDDCIMRDVDRGADVSPAWCG